MFPLRHLRFLTGRRFPIGARHQVRRRLPFGKRTAAVVAVFLPLAGPLAAADCRIAVFGDSLVAGYGVAPQEAFPARLDAALDAVGYADCEVRNAGVSGDTTAGGKARIDWVLADRPTHLLLELGANDALRALPVARMRDNLAFIIERAQARGVAVLLAGMLAPPNLGEAYGRAFAAVYTELAARFDIPLYPFFLDGVATDPRYLQADGLHPNAAGIEVVVARILPTVTAWLRATGIEPAN